MSKRRLTPSLKVWPQRLPDAVSFCALYVWFCDRAAVITGQSSAVRVQFDNIMFIRAMDNVQRQQFAREAFSAFCFDVFV